MDCPDFTGLNQHSPQAGLPVAVGPRIEPVAASTFVKHTVFDDKALRECRGVMRVSFDDPVGVFRYILHCCLLLKVRRIRAGEYAQECQVQRPDVDFGHDVLFL